MSSAVTEAATWETSVIGPDGTDLISAAGVRTGLQDLANRTKWLNESKIVGGAKSLNMAGNDYPDGTSYATIADTAPLSADFTLTVSAGDIVTLHATGALSFTAANVCSYDIRWYNGSAALATITYDKAAAWTAGETLPIAMSISYVVTSGGSMTFSLQGKRSGTSTVIQGGTLDVSYTHNKIGA